MYPTVFVWITKDSSSSWLDWVACYIDTIYSKIIIIFIHSMIGLKLTNYVSMGVFKFADVKESWYTILTVYRSGKTIIIPV